jgi:hypothetical protein
MTLSHYQIQKQTKNSESRYIEDDQRIVKILRYIQYLQLLLAEFFEYTLELQIYPISVIFSGGIFSISVGVITTF